MYIYVCIVNWCMFYWNVLIVNVFIVVVLKM